MPTTTANDLPDVPDFDLDAWIDGSLTPTATVKVTNDPGVVTRITAVADRIKNLELAGANAKDTGRAAGRRAALKEHPDLAAAREEMRAIVTGHDDTWIDIHITGPTTAQVAQTADENDTRLQILIARLALCGTVSKGGSTPAQITAEKWAALLDAIRSAQTITVEEAMNKLIGQAVTPDFSERALSLLGGDTSSSS